MSFPVERAILLKKLAEAQQQIVGGVVFEWTEYYDREADSFHSVKVVNICRLLDNLFGTDWSQRPSYEDSGRAVMRWCKENKASYYAADRENFNLHYACEQAKGQGHNVVVVEDLS